MYRLQTPLNSDEADVLSLQHAFRRVPDGDAIWADFSTEEDREQAAQALRDLRVKTWRDGSQ